MNKLFILIHLLLINFVGKSQYTIDYAVLNTVFSSSKKEKTVLYNPIEEQLYFKGKIDGLKDIKKKKNRKDNYENALYVSSIAAEEEQLILIVKVGTLSFINKEIIHIGVKYSYKILLTCSADFLSFERKTVWLEGDW